MCDHDSELLGEDVHGQCDPEPADRLHLDRRSLLGAVALAPFAALLPSQAVPARATASLAPTSGLVRAALHVHSSFSEGGIPVRSLASRGTFASMESQVAALTSMGVDLCFFTDHDHLLAAETAGLTPTAFPARERLSLPHWGYQEEAAGSPTAGQAKLTPVGLDATVSAGATRAAQLMYADCTNTQRDYRATLADLTLALNFRPRTTTGWTEVRIRGSVRPATVNRPAGTYEVHYRLTPSAPSRSVVRSGLKAVVTVPVTAGARQTVVLNPVADLGAAFSDLGILARDSGFYGLWLGAGAPAGSSASTIITDLRLRRAMTGAQRIDLQRQIVDELSRRYPSMSIGHGVEMSYSSHINWYGSDSSQLEVLRPAAGTGVTSYLKSVVSLIRSRGGVASVNHPFGTSAGTVLSGAAYRTMLSTTAGRLLSARAYGAQVLEVGYEQRGQMDVTGHLALWDILLSSGLRLMANGVSDDHAGSLDGWLTGSNRYFTDVISDTAEPAAVVPLLSSGRCFVSLRPRYAGMIDLSCDSALMGGSRSSTGSTATVTATADALPSGGTLRVVQMPVHGDLTRNTGTPPLWERTVTPNQLTSGAISVGVANVASYLRTEVRDGAGTVVGFSNPLFLTPAPQ